MLLVLTGLLLLALAAPCPVHIEAPAGSTQSVTSSAALPLDHAGTDASCTAASGLLGATTRAAECCRFDSGSIAVIHAVSGDERAGAGPHRLTAAVGKTDLPHGWSLLVLLGIERK
jgi:hypothetical protein